MRTPASAAAMWGDTGSGSNTGLSSPGGTQQLDAARRASTSSLASTPFVQPVPAATGFMPTTRG